MISQQHRASKLTHSQPTPTCASLPAHWLWHSSESDLSARMPALKHWLQRKCWPQEWPAVKLCPPVSTLLISCGSWSAVGVVHWAWCVSSNIPGTLCCVLFGPHSLFLMLQVWFTWFRYQLKWHETGYASSLKHRSKASPNTIPRAGSHRALSDHEAWFHHARSSACVRSAQVASC